MELEKRKLFIVFNRARAKARKFKNTAKLLDRIRKAMGILQSKEYYVAERALYSPTASSCGCKDWEFHLSPKRAYTGPCKHMIAEVLLERVRQIQYQQTNFLVLVGG